MLLFQYLGECIKEEYVYVISYFLVLNLTAFFMYRSDKKKAQKNGTLRIPEATLITSAALGGALGALLGMFVFHHKTRHAKFWILNPLLLLIWVGFMSLCLLS